MAFWKRKKKRTTAKPKINASISKVEKPKKISEKHDFVVHKEEHQVSLSPKPKMKNLPTFKPDRYEKEFMNIFRQLVSEKNRPWIFGKTLLLCRLVLYQILWTNLNLMSERNDTWISFAITVSQNRNFFHSCLQIWSCL